MTNFVLDCSIAAAWLFDDEASPKTDELLQSLRNAKAIVPSIWHLELGNVLVQAEQRNRITAAQIANRIELLKTLPISTDHETSGRAFNEILNIARERKLTTYDAAYLELAMRTNHPLATLDKALIRAALLANVVTLPS